jgi:hypothetical protein
MKDGWMWSLQISSAGHHVVRGATPEPGCLVIVTGTREEVEHLLYMDYDLKTAQRLLRRQERKARRQERRLAREE